MSQKVPTVLATGNIWTNLMQRTARILNPIFIEPLLIPSLNDTTGKSWEDLAYVRSYIVAAISARKKRF